MEQQSRPGNFKLIIEDNRTHDTRGEPEPAAGRAPLLRELAMCRTAEKFMLWRPSIFRHLNEGFADVGRINTLHIIVKQL